MRGVELKWVHVDSGLLCLVKTRRPGLLSLCVHVSCGKLPWYNGSLQIHYQASHSRGHGTQRITHQKMMLKSHGLLNQLNVHSEEQGEKWWERLTLLVEDASQVHGFQFPIPELCTVLCPHSISSSPASPSGVARKRTAVEIGGLCQVECAWGQWGTLALRRRQVSLVPAVGATGTAEQSWVQLYFLGRGQVSLVGNWIETSHILSMY